MHFIATTPIGKRLYGNWSDDPGRDIETKSIRVKQSHPFGPSPWHLSDGKWLACHRGGPPHVVQLWDCVSQSGGRASGFAGHVYALTFSPTASWLRRRTSSEQFA